MSGRKRGGQAERRGKPKRAPRRPARERSRAADLEATECWARGPVYLPEPRPARTLEASECFARRRTGNPGARRGTPATETARGTEAEASASPAPEKPAPTKPARKKPAPAKPARKRSGPAKAAHEKSGPAKPARKKSGPAKAARKKPAPAKAAPAIPTAAEPVPAIPTAAEPVPAIPTAAEPAPAVPALAEPAPDRSPPPALGADPGGPCATPSASSFGPEDWVCVRYEGPGVFVHREAGVFVPGTSTRLRGKVARALVDVGGFRIAA